MSTDEKKVGVGANVNVNVETLSIRETPRTADNADDALLAELGYKAEFKREFSVRRRTSRCSAHRGLTHVSHAQMLETIAFAVSIMGVIASVTSTFSFPLASGV